MRGSKGRLRRASHACALSVFIGSGLVCPAVGHAGPVEQFSQLLLNDQQPDLVALRYEYGGDGLLISRDGGRSFSLTCNAALGSGLRPTAAYVAADGQLLLGAIDGLQHDDGRACSLIAEPSFDGRWVTDFAAHPTDPNVAFAVSAAVASVPSGLFRRDPDGSFSPLVVGDGSLVTRLRVVARSDGGLRFYESTVAPATQLDPATGNPPPSRYFIRFSDDVGAHWTTHPVPTDGGSMRLEAVDRRDPERLLVSVAHDLMPDQLLRSDDGGASFEPFLSVTKLGGLVILPDGRVFIGDAGETLDSEAGYGLWAADDLASTPKSLSTTYPVRCLGYRASDQQLLACQRFAFGAVDMNDGEFTPWVRLKEVSQMNSCDGIDVRASCQATLLQAYCGISHFPCAPICDAYGVDLGPLAGDANDPELARCLVRRGVMSAAPPAADAGAADQTGSAATPPTTVEPETPPHTQPGNCALLATPRGSAAGPLAAALLAAALLLRRRQRRQWSGTGSSLPSGRW
jgi:hypothetical protein